MEITVYRLETSERNHLGAGRGPFDTGSELASLLAPHAGPSTFAFHPDYASLGTNWFLENLMKMSNAGWIFGWGSRRKMHDFIRPAGGIRAVRSHDMRIVRLIANDYFIFPDGQIMFADPRRVE